MGLRLRQLQVSLPGKVLLQQLPVTFQACQVEFSYSCRSACQVTERQLSRYSLLAVNHSAKVAEDLLSGILFQLTVGSPIAQGQLSRYSLTTVGQNWASAVQCPGIRLQLSVSQPGSWRTITQQKVMKTIKHKKVKVKPESFGTIPLITTVLSSWGIRARRE